MPEASLNGAGIVYDVAGKGPPCVALHGGLGMDHSYLRLALEPFHDVCTMVYPDQRGNGLSERVALDTITLPQLAADVEALREHLGFERVGVWGHSYGGFVALEYATTYADRLSHLVLLDTSPGAFEPTPDELAERGDASWITSDVQEALAAMATLPADDEAMEEAMPKLAPAYVKNIEPAVLSEQFEEMIFDAAALVAGINAFAGWSVVDKLAAIGSPTLVACGRYDLQTPPECAKRLSSAIPGAELLMLEESAHFPWLEEPEVFYPAVRGWLQRML